MCIQSCCICVRKVAKDRSSSNVYALYVQALFVLGDMALVTYDLPEAQRILSIVALTAADGQVRTCMHNSTHMHAVCVRFSAWLLGVCWVQVVSQWQCHRLYVASISQPLDVCCCNAGTALQPCVPVTVL